MSFLDEALGLSTHIALPDEAFLTAGFDCQFIGGTAIGDLVAAETEAVNATTLLIFHARPLPRR